MKEQEQLMNQDVALPEGMQFEDFFSQKNVRSIPQFWDGKVTEEDIVNMLFFYAVGKKEMKLDTLLHLSKEEKTELADAFLADAQKEILPDPEVNKEVKKDLAWYGENCAPGYTK